MPPSELSVFSYPAFPMIETKNLTKIYRTYRKEPGLWGAVKGLG